MSVLVVTKVNKETSYLCSLDSTFLFMMSWPLFGCGFWLFRKRRFSKCGLRWIRRCCFNLFTGWLLRDFSLIFITQRNVDVFTWMRFYTPYIFCTLFILFFITFIPVTKNRRKVLSNKRSRSLMVHNGFYRFRFPLTTHYQR